MSGFDVQGAAQRINAEFRSIKTGTKVEAGENDGDFGKVLQSYLKETNEIQNSADGALNDLVAGKTDDVHEVMLAMAKADVSFKMMVEVRNKLVEAYQEIMRMQV